MSKENAEANLREFGKEIKQDNLKFDENNTCILGIDDAFSMHLTYEPNADRLYIYSPLLDTLPEDDKVKVKLYETLLDGSMLGGKMAGGGVGVATKEKLILLHCTLDMSHAYDTALRAFAALYVETVEKWRQICKDIIEGREPQPFTLPGMPGPDGQPIERKAPQSKNDDKGGPAAPGSGFIKI